MSFQSDRERQRMGTPPEPWRPLPLELVVCEPLEDEAQRSAAQKSDIELAEMYAIALRAHAAATEGNDREGEIDYWDVLQRAIVEESARRPDFGQGALDGDRSDGRRERRRRRKRLEVLIAAREPGRASSGETA